MTIKFLPVRPMDDGEQVHRHYLVELYSVKNGEELQTFASRWRLLYEESQRPRPHKNEKGARRVRATLNSLTKLIEGNVNWQEAFCCIHLLRMQGVCKHTKQYSCPGMHLIAPLILIQTSHLAAKYGVATDLALCQASKRIRYIAENWELHNEN